MAGLEVTVGGRWLSLESHIGDVEMSTCWPGGSDTLSWTFGTMPTHRYRGGEDTRAYVGPECVWAGSLPEPDPSQDQMTATGAFREGVNYMALDSSGSVTTIPDVAIDNAIDDGLRWTRPASIQSTLVVIDTSTGPTTVGALLDMYSENKAQRWGVDTARQVYAKDPDTAPTYQTLPLNQGLGYALDDYASTLIGRFFNSATSKYETATVTDSTAAANHGNVQAAVDLTGRGPITASRATIILQSLLTLGRAVPQWTTAMAFSYGEVLSMSGAPVMLETVAAGTVIRVHGGYDLAQRLNGAMYLDVPIGRTQLSAGTLTITPLNMVVGTLEDALTEALSKKGSTHA